MSKDRVARILYSIAIGLLVGINYQFPEGLLLSVGIVLLICVLAEVIGE